ncbi:MAG: WD40 repeat domain-containing protein [Gemmataceae bacterium]
MKQRRTFPSDQVTSVTFTPPEGKLVAGSYSSIVLYDAATSRREAVLEKARSNSGISNVAVSNDGRTLARASNHFLRPGSIKLWDIGARKLKRIIPGVDTSAVSFVAFSGDGRNLFSAGGSFEQAGDVTCWDAETGVLKEVLVEHTDEISSVILSANGEVLLAQVGAKLLSWDSKTGRRTSSRTVMATDAFAASADGQRIAAVDEEASIRLLDMMTGKVRRTIRRQANVVAFSPDGRTLAAGSERGLSFWDVETGSLQWQLKTALDVHQLAFSFRRAILGSAYDSMEGD